MAEIKLSLNARTLVGKKTCCLVSVLRVHSFRCLWVKGTNSPQSAYNETEKLYLLLASFNHRS